MVQGQCEQCGRIKCYIFDRKGKDMCGPCAYDFDGISNKDSAMSDYKVGDYLWFVPSGRAGSSHSVKIVTVGRKWLTLDDGRRVDKVTLVADGKGYSSPGTCYQSQKFYEDGVALYDAWSDFVDKVRYQNRARPGVTLDIIKQARSLLLLD